MTRGQEGSFRKWNQGGRVAYFKVTCNTYNVCEWI